MFIRNSLTLKFLNQTAKNLLLFSRPHTSHSQDTSFFCCLFYGILLLTLQPGISFTLKISELYHLELIGNVLFRITVNLDLIAIEKSAVHQEEGLRMLKYA